jgi:hypothetical protein
VPWFSDDSVVGHRIRVVLDEQLYDVSTNCTDRQSNTGRFAHRATCSSTGARQIEEAFMPFNPDMIIDDVSVKLPTGVSNFLFSDFRIVRRAPVQRSYFACDQDVKLLIS